MLQFVWGLAIIWNTMIIISLPWQHWNDMELKALFIYLPLCESTLFVLHCTGSVLVRINSLWIAVIRIGIYFIRISSHSIVAQRCNQYLSFLVRDINCTASYLQAVNSNDSLRQATTTVLRRVSSSQFFLIPCSSPVSSNAKQPVTPRSDTKCNTKWKELIRTNANCYEWISFVLAVRMFQTVWNIRWKPWDYSRQLTRSSTEQYDSGDLLRIHIRISSPSWFATV